MSTKKHTANTWLVRRTYKVTVTKEVQANSIQEAVEKLSALNYDDFDGMDENEATPDESVFLVNYK